MQVEQRGSMGRTGMKNASWLSSDLYSIPECGDKDIFTCFTFQYVSRPRLLRSEKHPTSLGSLDTDSHASALIKSWNEGGALKKKWQKHEDGEMYARNYLLLTRCELHYY